MAKDMLSHPTMTNIVSANKNLVNFFTKSHFWANFLEEWCKGNKIGHGLMTACKTSWYSMAKVCITVSEHEGGFKNTIKANNDPLFDSTKISANSQSIISDCDHFTAYQAFIDVLKLVVQCNWSIGTCQHNSFQHLERGPSRLLCSIKDWCLQSISSIQKICWRCPAPSKQSLWWRYPLYCILFWSLVSGYCCISPVWP